ncbi:hypothetical protein GCM10027046_19460 [Uliginosibacterium flavum]|uniref:Uncharacterized protein n=1 Tax=Uliginosibacterium flavum TaxID=1396831 RepID=A0ABV2TFS5_9RHOO
MRSHADIDARSLALHRLITEKIQREPALHAHAEATITRWRQTVCAASQPYLDEWFQALQAGASASLKLATEDSEHARALRQCSPFTEILSNQERFNFLKTWRTQHEA